MPAKGRTWEVVRTQFREECKANNEPCWLCKEPINYYAPSRSTRSFSADHVVPTSLPGGQQQALRKANLRASHYGCNSSRGNTTRGEFPTSRQW
jgi:5-methylcytosine-specific restriction endonuclease McrA